MTDNLFEELERSMDGLDAFLDGLSQGRALLSRNRHLATRPSIDVNETEKEIQIDYEIPGLDKEDISLKVIGHRIEVSAKKRQETRDEKEGYSVRGRNYYRSMTLQSEVDAENVKATYKDGILRVILPKAEKPKQNSIKIE